MAHTHSRRSNTGSGTLDKSTGGVGQAACTGQDGGAPAASAPGSRHCFQVGDVIELLGTLYPGDPWTGVIGVCTHLNFLDYGTRFEIIPGPGWFWLPKINTREYRLITRADITGIENK